MMNPILDSNSDPKMAADVLHVSNVGGFGCSDGMGQRQGGVFDGSPFHPPTDFCG